MPTKHLRPSFELEQATITAIEQDNLGQIWIGTQNGVLVWDGMETSKPLSQTQRVNAVYSSDSCVFIVDLVSVHKLNIHTQQSTSYKLPYFDYWSSSFESDYLQLVSANQKDTLSITTSLSISNKRHTSVEKSCTIGEHKFVLQDNLKGVSVHDHDTTIISSSLATDLIKFNNNTVFVSTNEGLIQIKLKDGLTEYKHLKNKRIEKLMVDRNQNLWVGTADDGLLMYHRTTIENEYYPISPENATNAAWRFTQYGGKIYACTSLGMFQIPSRKIPNELERKTKGLFCITAFATEEKLFIGTSQKGLYVFENGALSNVFFNEHSNEMLDNTIIEIKEFQGNILFTTKLGLHLILPNGELLSSKPFHNAKGKTYAMNSLIENDQIISATTSGMHWYSSNLEFIRSENPANVRVFSDVKRYKNKLWAASFDRGLYSIESDSLQLRYLSNVKPLGMHLVNNQLWGIGLTGLFHLDDTNYIEYSYENGFPIKEYSQGGMFSQDSEHLYLGGVGGVFVYKLSTSHSLELPSWQVLYDSSSIQNGATIVLDFDQSIVSITAKAIITSDLPRYQLRYFHEEKWKILDNAKPLLIHLSYGSNHLKFKVVDKHTNKSNVVEYTFVRNEPIWRSLWFQILLVLLIVLLLAGVYFLVKFLNTRRLMKKEIEERKISQERLRISRELHDNIGARLSHIISSLDIEMYKNQGTDQLGVINVFARDTMNQLRETIWAVGDRTIFFSELKQRVEHYLIQTGSISVYEVIFDDKTSRDFQLNATQTINLFRIVQEAVNNALKYSQGKAVIISFSHQREAILMTIEDDGQGFELNDAIRLGSGLNGMKERANEIGAELRIESSKQIGTKIHVIWKTL